MGVRQKNISGIFRRFLFSFLLAGAATILVLGVVVQILTIKAVIHPANYDEQQLEQKREEIQEAEKVEERMLPYGTRFGVFDNSGRWLYGTFTESEREEVWKAVLEEKNEIRSGYLKRFQREEEICLVSYQLRVQFGNPALRERFPHVLELLLLAALLIFCAEVMFLIRYFSRKIKQELQKIEWMTEKIEHQDLEFPCPDSQVLEIKKILETFGRMRDTLKESLMKQWELESARKEQMGALAHDLKTPLQLMGEAESLEEAQKYSLALEQEIQGIEEYLQILQEMISTGGYQMYKKEQVDHLIDLYFEGNCDDRTRIKIYCYIAVCGLLWSNWCEYKRKLGVEFGEYSLRQYRYAKDYYKIVQQELGEEGKEICTK